MRTVWAIVLCVWSSVAAAQEVRFQWVGFVEFDANARLESGATLGALMAAFFGDQAYSGRVPISGGLSYDMARPPIVQTPEFLGLRDAVTSFSLQFGTTVVQADFGRIASRAFTSDYAAVSRGGSYCTTRDRCISSGLPFQGGWGNLIAVVNSASHQAGTNRSTTNRFGDGMLIGIGGTDVVADFVPAMQTASFGQVAVHSASLRLASFPDRQFLYQLRVPHMRELIGTQSIEYTSLTLNLEVAGQRGVVGMQGYVEEFIVLP